MNLSMRWKLVLALAVTMTAMACKKDDESKAKDKAKDKGAAPVDEPAGKPAQPDPKPTPPADPYAQGFCEYTIDGGEPNKGGGGMSNVMSIHWMAADQQGRSLASPLIVNCGAGTQLNLMSSAEGVPMGAKKYVIGTLNKPGQFTVLGPDFMGGDGELEITEWDTSHVAGTFAFTSQGKKYAGGFDLRCPLAGNGVCP